MRNFHDRRPAAPRPKGELRNKLALEHHIKVEHGSGIPESGQGEGEVSHSWLRWHHDVMHGDEFDIPNVPHEH